ncbi:hypothetical protein H4696_004028 [Amycolatopsis lexingtonensis]|uniref:Uncharacterized protein n=1 Tax=Amycolatopsis lexingtonensis TaxID=218822 RepID=A0ABR9I185_9PSEU|nr:hypothetical protein [Amycolatopsis lexingtonensis]
MNDSFKTLDARASAKSCGQATLPPVSRSPHVLNDSFRSSGVLNESFKTLEHRCGPHRRDFAGALTPDAVNDSFLASPVRS